MKIYTKTGDSGQTSLFGGKRVLKSDLRVEAYGTVDELNSTIGFLVAQVKNVHIKKELVQIQNDLLTIGASLANPKQRKESSLEERVMSFENFIDELTKKLPDLRNFILPGGGKTGSLFHCARSICRRAERRVVELSQREKIAPEILEYFNRLSDLLFTIARFVNYREKKKEYIWQLTTR